ncbi:aspartate/glutamate racemase family protein [Neorhizobium sp. NCHU2750]|uniref:aspartate/glutamate racemase family protein n=1 Tax=Neorhizobium sp. NCHU2750 TaxID=1825976 RepID=UPI000E75910A|nr:hydantoin racemase [Neorhizobium sp. NCHU2750]
MKTIALINPNTSQATTAMMVDIIRRYLPPEFSVAGLTATIGVPMILDENALSASANGVIEMGIKAVADNQISGIVIGAFGDPGIEVLRTSVAVPVVGLCEASLLEASRDGRRFGIATVTPDLVSSFAAKAESLGLSPLFTGTRLTPGDPLRLAGDPARLHEALAIATRESIERDRAEAVIIGGGPLGQAAESLRDLFTVPIIAPLASAASMLMREIATRRVVGLETAG